MIEPCLNITLLQLASVLYVALYVTFMLHVIYGAERHVDVSISVCNKPTSDKFVMDLSFVLSTISISISMWHRTLTSLNDKIYLFMHQSNGKLLIGRSQTRLAPTVLFD